MRCGSRESHPDRHGHLPLLSDGNGARAARRARQQRPSRESPEAVVARQHASARGIGPIAVECRSGIDGGPRIDYGSSIGFESAHAELVERPQADANPFAAGAADPLPPPPPRPHPHPHPRPHPPPPPHPPTPPPPPPPPHPHTT